MQSRQISVCFLMKLKGIRLKIGLRGKDVVEFHELYVNEGLINVCICEHMVALRLLLLRYRHSFDETNGLMWFSEDKSKASYPKLPNFQNGSPLEWQTGFLQLNCGSACTVGLPKAFGYIHSYNSTYNNIYRLHCL